MKVWQIATAILGIGIIMVLIRNMQQSKASSVGATSNDVILGLSKFGSGLLDFGGKILAPSSNSNAAPGLGASVYGSPESHSTETIPSWGDSSNTG